jgi:hydrogenase nickel incorporation protein HypA/HybF
MHELAVTENILEIVKTHAERAGASKVTDIFLVIGKLSSIVDDSVQFYWDLMTEETIAEGAKLHFRRLPILIQCNDCKNSYTPEGESLACPLCMSEKITIIQGEEFYLEAIDIDK